MDFETVEGAFLKANLWYIDENYNAALDSYNEAIELDTDKDWRILDKRAACKLKLKDYDGCVKDCREAIAINPKAVTSHFRMGIAHFLEEKYELCQKPFKNALESMTKEYEFLRKRTRRWQRKVTAELRMRKKSNLPTKEERKEEKKKKEKEEAERSKLEAIKKKEEEEKKKKKKEEVEKKEDEVGTDDINPPPELETVPSKEESKEEEEEEEETKKEEEEKEKKGEYAREEVKLTEDWPSRYNDDEEKVEEDDGKSKIGKNIRFDHYQSDFVLSVNFYGLNKVPITDRKVECTGKKLIITFKLPDADEVWERKIELYDEVKKHTVRNIKPKTEVTLHKLIPRKWPRLEKAPSDKEEEDVRKYPTNRPTDWEEVSKKTGKDDDSGGVNSLFKQIYESGDEETRKAMVKSLQESGGTVLSTNWKEVGKKTVKCSPPEGMERKRYDGYQYDGFMDSDSDSDKDDDDDDDFSRRGGKSYKWKK